MSRVTSNRDVHVASRQGCTFGVCKVREAFVDLLWTADKSVGIADHYLELTGISFFADEPTIVGAVDQSWVQREHDWFMSMDRSVWAIPGGPPKMWVTTADADGLVNSNYGHLMFSEENGLQLENCAAALRDDILSRQAVAVYTRPTIHEDSRANGMSDFMCTSTVQYLVRNGRLETIVVMRSNDVVHGYRNDWVWQDFCRRWVLDQVGNPDIQLGGITWQAGSLHLYPRHTKLLRAAIEHDPTGRDWAIPFTVGGKKVS